MMTVISYVPGNGREGEGAREPAPLVRTHLATSRDAAAFGTMAGRAGRPQRRARRPQGRLHRWFSWVKGINSLPV